MAVVVQMQSRHFEEDRRYYFIHCNQWMPVSPLEIRTQQDDWQTKLNATFMHPHGSLITGNILFLHNDGAYRDLVKSKQV